MRNAFDALILLAKTKPFAGMWHFRGQLPAHFLDRSLRRPVSGVILVALPTAHAQCNQRLILMTVKT